MLAMEKVDEISIVEFAEDIFGLETIRFRFNTNYDRSTQNAIVCLS
jgi:hypothetical protein